MVVFGIDEVDEFTFLSHVTPDFVMNKGALFASGRGALQGSSCLY